MKIGLILFIGGVNYAILTTALVLNHLLDNLVENELYLGFRHIFNTTYRDCVWRKAVEDRQRCAEDVKIVLYSNGTEELIDTRNSKWLLSSGIWSASKENVVFVHGYAAGDNSPPTLMMRDAFIRSNTQLFMIDYGPVSRAPCYVQLVQNIKHVSYCIASYIRDFVKSGMQRQTITCVGHSMGAHGCGLLRRYLGFRPNKIIGLDAALPLISESDRLSWRDAKSVQTIQTNAGYYGDIGSIGHLDICVNNGNIQPFCADSSNPNLCSHLYSLCFLAESLFDSKHQLQAKRCSEVCPHLSIFQLAKMFPSDYSAIHDNAIDDDDDDDENILIGMNISESARGSYCLSSLNRPFCSTSDDKIGSRRCCSLINMFTID